MTILDLTDMPGPSDAARALQLAQYAAHDAMYDAWNEAHAKANFNYEAANQDAAYRARVQDYEKTVADLEALLGPDAHCNEVDTDLWSSFSDCFKDEAGFRPRFHQTRLQVQQYFARRSAARQPESH